MRGARMGCAVTMALAFLPCVAAGQNGTAGLRARFDRESDAVRKARLMPKLGEAQFAEIRERVRAGQFPEAVAAIEQYRTEAEASEQGLDALRVNAEKHPAGFKELEISVRESLRRINEMVHGMAADEQQPFLETHKELSEMDQRLVQQLFPKR